MVVTLERNQGKTAEWYYTLPWRMTLEPRMGAGKGPYSLLWGMMLEDSLGAGKLAQMVGGGMNSTTIPVCKIDLCKGKTEKAQKNPQTASHQDELVLILYFVHAVPFSF